MIMVPQNPGTPSFAHRFRGSEKQETHEPIPLALQLHCANNCRITSFLYYCNGLLVVTGRDSRGGQHIFFVVRLFKSLAALKREERELKPSGFIFVQYRHTSCFLATRNNCLLLSFRTFRTIFKTPERAMLESHYNPGRTQKRLVKFATAIDCSPFERSVIPLQCCTSMAVAVRRVAFWLTKTGNSVLTR